MDITPANIEQFFKGLDFRFRMGQMAPDTFYKDVATIVPSSTSSNLYPWLAKIPQMREWIGPRVVNNIKVNSYELRNKKFEDTISVEKDHLADDQYGFYGDVGAMLGAETEEFPDRQIALALEAGTSQLCWDGQFFFDTDHPIDPDGLVSGTNSNLKVGAGFDIAVADPLVPFSAARAAMMLWKREDGQQMGTVGDTIMVHPNEEKFALQIATAVNLGQVVGSGAATPSNVFQGKVRVIVNPFLTATSGRPWYLLATKKAIKPLLWQVRQPAVLTAKTALTDDNVFLMQQFLWGVDLRAAAGYSFPFLAFRMSAS